MNRRGSRRPSARSIGGSIGEFIARERGRADGSAMNNVFHRRNVCRTTHLLQTNSIDTLRVRVLCLRQTTYPYTICRGLRPQKTPRALPTRAPLFRHRRLRFARGLTSPSHPSIDRPAFTPRSLTMGAGQSAPEEILKVASAPTDYAPPLEVNPANPLVYFDIQLGRYGDATKLGRIVMELKADTTPKTVRHPRVVFTRDAFRSLPRRGKRSSKRFRAMAWEKRQPTETIANTHA